jgi:hypothetical protein
MLGTATALSSYYYPTAVSWGYPHLEVFIPSKNQTESVYWKYRGLTSSDTVWNPTDGSLAYVSSFLGGGLAAVDTSITAITRSKGNVDIFVTAQLYNNADHIFHGSNGSWGDWEYLVGECLTAPAAVSYDENHMDMFVLIGYVLFHQSWNQTSGWGSWKAIGGGNWTLFVPTPVSWGEGRLDVFVVDSNSNQLYHTYWNGSTWQPPPFSFESLGGYCTSRPVAISRSTGQIDVFVRGGDSGLWHISYSSNNWSPWMSISGNTSI